MKSIRHFASFAGVLALALISPANAGVNSWTFTGPGGGAVDAVAIQPTNSSVLLASTGNGTYRSEDAGLTWTWVGDGADGAGIVYDPSATQRVFIVSNGGRMYRSGDNGSTFTRLTTLVNASPHRLAVAGDGTVYVADRQGIIHRSTDAGENWTALPHPWASGDEKVSAVAVNPTPAPVNSQVVYASVLGVGTYKSVDGGQNWILPAGASPGCTGTNERVYDIAFKPGHLTRMLAATDAALYISDDAGASWSAAHDGPWYALAFDTDPAAPNKVIALGFRGQVRRSLDSGDTWPSSQDGPLLNAVQALDIAVAGNRVIAGTGNGPVVSGDAGSSFALRVSGMHSESVRAFATNDSGALLASFVPGPFGVFKRVGVDWVPADNAELLSAFPAYPMILELAVSPASYNRLYAIGTFDSLLQSADGGETWYPPVPQFLSSGIGLTRVIMDPVDLGIAYVTTETAGVWKTVNNGFTFVKRSTGLPTRVRALAIDPANPLVLYVGGYFSGNNGVFKSTNGGDSWTQVGAATLPANAVNELYIDPEDSQRVYAILHNSGVGLYVSTDGGATWAPVPFGNPPALYGVSKLFIDPALPTTLIAGSAPSTNGGFARSVDRGATWQSVNFEPIHASLGGFENMAIDRGFGMVIGGGYGTGLYAYQIATDLSVDLADLPGPLALNSTGSIGIPVTNHGPFDAAAPDLHINIPANLTVTVPAGCQFTAPNMRCELPAIRNGQTHTVTLNYVAASQELGGTLGATVLAREYDPVYTNHQDALTVWVVPLAELQLTSTATATVLTSSPVTYTATVRNNGPNATTTTTFALAIPAGITVQSTTPSAGTCTTTAATLTCELGAMASGNSATVSVGGTAITAGTMSWDGTVAGSGTDNVSTNNRASSITSVTVPPPPPVSNSSSGGGGGGGRIEWLSLLLLGLLARRRLAPAQEQHSRQRHA